jgi:hypothetical protein
MNNGRWAAGIYAGERGMKKKPQSFTECHGEKKILYSLCVLCVLCVLRG